MTSRSLAAVKAHFSQVIDEVSGTHERVTVTKNGSPVAVILAVEDYESLSETLEILSDPRARSDIRQAAAGMAAGDATTRLRCGARSRPVADDVHGRPLSSGQASHRTGPPRPGGAAVVDFLYGPLAADLHRVGKPPRFELDGYWSAERGQYRVIYSIHDDEVRVRVVRISHRADAYG
jgi:antitoxin YefM